MNTPGADTAVALPLPDAPDARWRRVRMFAMDVDGVLTDGTLFVSSDGVETKQFSVLDGLGLVRLRQAGVIVAWISGRESGATTMRARELAVAHLVQGRHDKAAALQELATSTGVPLDEVCYMGDDDIDAAAMRVAGIAVTVPDAMPAARRGADYVTSRAGGRGAVREVCDLILAARTATP